MQKLTLHFLFFLVQPSIQFMNYNQACTKNICDNCIPLSYLIYVSSYLVQFFI